MHTGSAKKIGSAILALLLMLCFAEASFALSALPNRSLRLGSRGAQVRLLQENLYELGVYVGQIDGVYGRQTGISVQKLQSMLHIAQDGVCGSQTIAAFNSQIEELSKHTAPTTSARESTGQTTAGLPLTGITVGIDAGHQEKASKVYEPIAPNSERTKARMTPGAIGVKTGAQEYEIVLFIAKKLQKLLENAGASVVMSRSTHDVDISNKERAELMNEAEVDCWVRLHCDSSIDSALTGTRVLSPAKTITPDIYQDSLTLSKCLLVYFCKETGSKQLPIALKEDQTGFNWSQSPVATVEMGYLSNPPDEALLTKSSYQDTCAKGLYKGIAAYFVSEKKLFDAIS